MTVHTLDLDFQGVSRSIAAYLVQGPDGPFLVETGPASTVERLLERLREHDVEPEAIRDVFVTHIHLDHAGAAGWWARRGARVHVHARGAEHLVDPSRLLASASRIYGDRMDELWGETLSAPEANVNPIEDGAVVSAGGLSVRAIDTPGHAKHHHVFRVGDVGFTGDAAGIHVPDSPLVDLPAPPPEFDREAWMTTIDRLEAERFARIYPTHFGPLDDVAARLEQLRTAMNEAVATMEAWSAEGLDRDAIMKRYLEWNRERAKASGLDWKMIHRYETANPPYMSVDGILRYLRKREERANA